jgi:hypothetical protein
MRILQRVEGSVLWPRHGAISDFFLDVADLVGRTVSFTRVRWKRRWQWWIV